MDKVILVRADINQRIEWLEKRNGWSVSEIQARINSQMSDEEKMKFADFIIWNREKKQVQDEVLQIHKLLSR
jgi:dephospho-CoA kinase